MWATLTVEGVFEKHDGVPSLEQMQEFVKGPNQSHGWVEVVQIKHGIDMWINEEGKYEFPQEPASINRKATMFAHEAKSIFPGDYIAGPCVFTSNDEETGETASLTDVQFAYVAQAARIAEIGRVGSGVWNFTGVQL